MLSLQLPKFTVPSNSNFYFHNNSNVHHLLSSKIRIATQSLSRPFLRRLKDTALNNGGSSVSCSATQVDKDDDQLKQHEQDFQVLTAIQSNFNDIVIVDTPKSRLLLLDSTHNVHSMFNKEEKWTDSYWDEFVSLPAIIPEGPIAIYGLGGGTAAHLLLDLWPSLQLEGWEIDEILIDKAREYLGLSDLEKHTQDGGILNIRVGDIFSASASVPGGYGGIIIDLFSGGKVLPQLQEARTWLELNDRLMPNGRLMVNCGGSFDGTMGAAQSSSTHDSWLANSTIRALWTAFPGQLNWKKMTAREGENYLALTGPLPDLYAWSSTLPDNLADRVKGWKPFQPDS